MSFPYKEAVAKYRQKGWGGTLPLPEALKESPPEKFTGKAARYATPEELKSWMTDSKYANGNICLKMGEIVGTEWEVVGIDVDHYESGGKDKKGGDQLRDLEERFGPLPDTYISSARADGISGIRYFRVPGGLAFRGKASKDIDIISKGYRYAVVCPSVHPNGSVYLWYGKGNPPDGNGSHNIPNPMELPILPDPWIDFITAGRVEFTIDEISMDLNSDEMVDWAMETFGKPTELCYRMKEKVELHKKQITEDSNSHNRLVAAHWNLISLAAEGHYGVLVAVNEMEMFWKQDVISRGGKGRTNSSLNGEIYRSRDHALRKIKSQVEAQIALGAIGVVPDDPECCGATVALKPVQEYDMNDDGNAEHFIDFFTSESGYKFRYVDGFGWIVWDEGNEEKEIGPHWIRDRDGDQQIRRMWRQVKERQLQYVEFLYNDWQNEIQAAINAGLPSSGTSVNVPNSLKKAYKLYLLWERFATLSGNNRNAENAIKAVRSKDRIKISINDLDKNSQLIACKNGVLELNGGKVKLRPAKPEDYITMNTNVMWKEPTGNATRKWNDYLDTFMPDLEERKIAQIALGSCLPGGNAEKVVILLMGDPNTGKSTMVNSMESALGDYAVTVDHSVFQVKQFNPTLTSAINCRMAIGSEIDKEDKLHAAMVKRISGGTDKVGTDIKFSMEKMIAVPQFVVILSTNGFPKIPGADKALLNRMYVIPFTVVPEIILKSQAREVQNVCAEAVLHFLIDGYIMYMELGYLPISPKIKAANRELAANLTDIGAFLSDCVDEHKHMENGKDWKLKPDWCVKPASLYTAFERWWNQENNQPNQIPSKKYFSTKVRELGYKKEKITLDGKQEWYWVGVKIKPFAESNVIPFKPSMN